MKAYFTTMCTICYLAQDCNTNCLTIVLIIVHSTLSIMSIHEYISQPTDVKSTTIIIYSFQEILVLEIVAKIKNYRYYRKITILEVFVCIVSLLKKG
jgi:hypothetical protein